VANNEPNTEPKLSGLLDVLEHAVYYGASAVLAITIGMIFVSTLISMLQALDVGLTQTVRMVLDQVLLIFIFVELLATIRIVAREREIVAEPFLLVGLIAVVRRILSVTAEAGQATGTEQFQNLVIELGALAVLVVALTTALYVTRRTRRRERSPEGS
jgi:uncharacterized membrane protein (DUF373 family)